MLSRGNELVSRVRVLSWLQVGVLLAALAVLLAPGRHPGSLSRIGPASLPPPWRGKHGLAILIRGGAVGGLLTLSMFLIEGGQLFRLFIVPLASLPLLMMAWQVLARPVGASLKDVWGLHLTPRVASGLVRVVPVILALGFAGDWASAWLSETWQLTSHWTEWFDADLVWGSPTVAASSVIEYVLVAPAVEEVIFRGLLYATLRRRFQMPIAAAVSAALFAGAHGYGWLGFVSVFWSGIIWAWAYEKTGSLLPGMVAHGLNNMLVCVTLLLLLRFAVS